MRRRRRSSRSYSERAARPDASSYASARAEAERGLPELPFDVQTVSFTPDEERLAGKQFAVLGALSLAQYRDAPRLLVERMRASDAYRRTALGAWPDSTHVSALLATGADDARLHDGDWIGRATVGSVRSALNGADHALAARVRELSEEISPELPALPSRRRRRVWADDGTDYDFDRLRDFHDRPATSRKRTVRSDPGTVHLVATFGGSGGTSAEALGWAGAPCLAVARALLDAGYSVSLDAVEAVASNGHAGAALEVVRLLEAGTSMETDDAALAGVVCDAATFRTFGFAASMLADPLRGRGLGSCRVNPARVYQACAQAGALPVPAWTFEPAFNRAAALAGARAGLRAIVERIAPELALTSAGSHDVAQEQGGGW